MEAAGVTEELKARDPVSYTHLAMRPRWEPNESRCFSARPGCLRQACLLYTSAARAAPVVEEGKLERKASVKVVEAGAPPVKDGRLIFGLCELVVDVLVFNRCV